MADDLKQRLLSRKFILCVLIELLTTVLTWYGKIDPGAFVTLTLAVGGGYITGNVLQKVKLADGTVSTKSS